MRPPPRSVFWDLYCAAPDRRETCEHSSEAKAFHDYVSMGGQTPCTPHPTHRIGALGTWGHGTLGVKPSASPHLPAQR